MHELKDLVSGTGLALVEQGQRALISTDDWFLTPDGDRKAVWGTCRYHKARDLFGFDPKAGAAFFVEVGEGDGSLLIAGCKAHYAVRCDRRPNDSLNLYVPPSDRGR